MKKNILKVTLFATFAMVAGMNVYNAQKSDVELSGLALENAEALASGEGIDRPDCEPNGESCDELVIYPDGDWGENMLLGFKKKAGWL